MKRRGAKKILETPLRRLLVLWAWPATRRGGNEGTVASHPCSLAPRAIPWDGGVQGLEGGVCGRAKSEESGRLLPSTLHYGWRLLPSTSCGMWASSTSILKGGGPSTSCGMWASLPGLEKNKFGFSSKSCRAKGFSSGRLPWPRKTGEKEACLSASLAFTPSSHGVARGRVEEAS